MKKTIIALTVAFAIALSFVYMNPLIVAQGQPAFSLPPNDSLIITDENGNQFWKGEYNVKLKNETFNSIDNNPKFLNKTKVTFHAQDNIQDDVVPQLKHEYDMAVGKKVFDKVRQYNGTFGNSLSPLRMQNAFVDDVFSHAIRGFEVENVKDISIFVNDPDIEEVAPKKVVYPMTQYTGFNGQRMGVNVMPGVNNVENFPDVDILVADTVVEISHPDLNIQVRTSGGIWPQCRVSLSSPWHAQGCNFNNVLPTLTHGTATAGIIAARDNLAGTVGPAAGARIWNAIVCNDYINNDGSHGVGCGGFDISLFDYITANANTFEVAQFSLGAGCPTGGVCNSPPTTAERNAVTAMTNAGVVVITAGGNEGAESSGENFVCSVASVICVSAMHDSDGKCGGLGPSFTLSQATRDAFDFPSTTQRDDTRSYFSNYGSDMDIMASGFASGAGRTITTHAVTSTSTTTASSMNTKWPFIGASQHGWYGDFGGTSEANPWVAGAAAKLVDLHPTWTPAQVKQNLIDEGTPQNAACNTSTGVGGLSERANVGSSERILNLRTID